MGVCFNFLFYFLFISEVRFNSLVDLDGMTDTTDQHHGQTTKQRQTNSDSVQKDAAKALLKTSNSLFVAPSCSSSSTNRHECWFIYSGIHTQPKANSLLENRII